MPMFEHELAIIPNKHIHHTSNSESSLDHLLQCLCSERLWSLDGEAEGTVPHLRGQNSKGSGHTKQHSVEAHFMHSIILQGHGQEITHQIMTCSLSSADLKQAATVSIHIGPRVLGLALLQENVRHYLKQLADQTEKRVIWKVFLSKFPLASIAWVSLAQHCMAISRDNLQNTSLSHHPYWIPRQPVPGHSLVCSK